MFFCFFFGIKKTGPARSCIFNAAGKGDEPIGNMSPDIQSANIGVGQGSLPGEDGGLRGTPGVWPEGSTVGDLWDLIDTLLHHPLPVPRRGQVAVRYWKSGERRCRSVEGGGESVLFFLASPILLPCGCHFLLKVHKSVALLSFPPHILTQ